MGESNRSTFLQMGILAVVMSIISFIVRGIEGMGIISLFLFGHL